MDLNEKKALFNVLANGKQFARVDCEIRAREYVKMQLAKRSKGQHGGKHASPAFAATMSWEVKRAG